MLRLLTIRHGKSSWKHPELKDHERPLNKRGRNDALLMGSILKDKGIELDRIYTSTAIRALSTAKLIAKELNLGQDPINEVEALYGTNLNQFLVLARNVLNTKDHQVAIVSHNPAITDFANYLIAGQEELDFKTCAIAAIDFHVDQWDQIAPAKGELAFYEYPKKHK